LSRNPLPVPVTDEVIETNAVDSGKQAWLQGWTAADMQAKQEADPNLKQILLWKQDRAAQPTQQEVQGASKATKSLWAQWKRLQLGNGVLYCNWSLKMVTVPSCNLYCPSHWYQMSCQLFMMLCQPDTLEWPKPLKEYENDFTGMACKAMSKAGADGVKSAQRGNLPRPMLEHHQLAAALVIRLRE